MSSNHATDRSWSLTRRLAVIFAVLNVGILACYALWSAYVVIEGFRDDIHSFLAHEVDELSANVARLGTQPEQLQHAVDQIALVSPDPPCAFRVRDSDGMLLAEAGSARVLALVSEPIPLEARWRERLFSDQIAIRARPLGDGGLRAEVIVDASDTMGRIRRYALTALLAFLATAVFGGLAGWFTAHRGLRGLRQVVSQARGISSPADAQPIRLEGAPREVREVGSELNALLGRIRDGLAAMQTFTAGLAHELRSPLQNLIGETEVVLLSARSSGEYQKTLRSNLEDLYELSDAVDNLVAFCRRNEPTQPDLQTESFDMAREARLRLARERQTAERKGLELRFSSAGDAQLRADREACLRVLRNLVGNALSWSPAGTAVEVRIEGQRDVVRVIVDDAGPGVSADLGSRIFEPFVTNRVKSGKRGGYGLGLAICKSVLDDHGGSLRYERSPSDGARFVAEFPRVRDGRHATDAPVPVARA